MVKIAIFKKRPFLFLSVDREWLSLTLEKPSKSSRGGKKGGKKRALARQGWFEVRVRFRGVGKRWRDLVKGVSAGADINWACHQGKRRDLPEATRYIEVAFSTPLKNSPTHFAEKRLESPRNEITFLFRDSARDGRSFSRWNLDSLSQIVDLQD